MKLLSFLLGLSLVLPSAHARRKSHRRRAPAAVNTVAKLKKVGSCKNVEGAKRVWIVKQWHLAPTLITKSFREKYPQEKNQTAIYQALAQAIKRKELQAVVAEGCGAGEINSDFKVAYNGWSYADLRKVAQTKGYDKILTSVPLKLEARFDQDVQTVCGDDEKLIQEGNLRLSNLRGWMGFATRLHETKDDAKLRLYSEAAADLLKVPKTLPPADVLAKVQARLGEEMLGFRNSLAERNSQFTKTLVNTDFTTAAVVIGGLHADDLKTKIEAENLNCDVFEPPGYQREDEQLIDSFESLLARAVAK